LVGGGQLFYKPFWPSVKFSSSTLRELSGQGSLITEGVAEKPRFVPQTSGLQAGALTNYTAGAAG